MSFCGISRIVSAVLLLGFSVPCGARETVSSNDNVEELENNVRKVKSGWSFFPFPTLSYTSDIGLNAGAMLDVYHYGRNPSYFPNYCHKFHIEGSHATKGQTLANFSYDSNFLIPDTRFVLDATYRVEPLYYLYGFNGTVSSYDSALDRKDGVARYCMNYEAFVARASFARKIAGALNGYAGASFWNVRTGNLSMDGYDSSRTLFREYADRGIIGEKESSGGSVMEFNLGLVYDSRDFETDPHNGNWSEVYLVGAPDIFNNGHPYLKLCAHFRQYLSPGNSWWTLACHLAYQGTIAGDTPFYQLPVIYTIVQKQVITEGLGGVNTLRGVLGKRLLGEGYAWMNLEFRARALNIPFGGHRISLAFNPFADAGFITRPYRLEAFSSSYGIPLDELSRETRRLHLSVGAGMKVGFDNNIVSIEAARSLLLGGQDGPFYIAVATNYIF